MRWRALWPLTPSDVSPRTIKGYFSYRKRSSLCAGSSTDTTGAPETLRVRAGHPLREMYCSQQVIAIGNQCVFGHRSAEVAWTRIGDNLARIVSCFQKLSGQLV